MQLCKKMPNRVLAQAVINLYRSQVQYRSHQAKVQVSEGFVFLSEGSRGEGIWFLAHFVAGRIHFHVVIRLPSSFSFLPLRWGLFLASGDTNILYHLPSSTFEISNGSPSWAASPPAASLWLVLLPSSST